MTTTTQIAIHPVEYERDKYLPSDGPAVTESTRTADLLAEKLPAFGTLMTLTGVESADPTVEVGNHGYDVRIRWVFPDLVTDNGLTAQVELDIMASPSPSMRDYYPQGEPCKYSADANVSYRIPDSRSIVYASRSVRDWIKPLPNKKVIRMNRRGFANFVVAALDEFYRNTVGVELCDWLTRSEALQSSHFDPEGHYEQ